MHMPALRQSARLVSFGCRRAASSATNSLPICAKHQSLIHDAAQRLAKSSQPTSLLRLSLRLRQSRPFPANDLHLFVAAAKGFSTSSTSFDERAEASTRRPDAMLSSQIRLAEVVGFLTMAGIVSTLLYVVWLGRPWDSDEERERFTLRPDNQATDKNARNEDTRWSLITSWPDRTVLRANDLLDYWRGPAWEPLLPEPWPAPFQRPFTLIIDLEDLLIKHSGDAEHGRRILKRPGVDYFLDYVSQFYEINVFTTEYSYQIFPILDELDPFGANIAYKLFRESTRYKNGTLIKDLTHLGRPLERTVVLETDPARVQLQPENSIILKPWTGKADESAKELVALIPFLESLVFNEVKDVRPIIKHYAGRNVAMAYAEDEARQKQQLVDQWHRDKQSKDGILATLLGSIVYGSDPTTPPMTAVERGRMAAQKQYLKNQQFWKKHGPARLQQLDEEVKVWNEKNQGRLGRLRARWARVQEAKREQSKS